MEQRDRSLEAREAPEAAHGGSDSEQELAEVLRQRAAISEVLRAIASSPHDLQPIFQTILDSAARLCRAEAGVFRLVEEAGLRLVAHKVSPVLLKEYPPPVLLEHSSFVARFIANKSPLHIPNLADHEVYRAGEAYAVGLVKSGIRTSLYVPMLRNDELIGVLSIGRARIEPNWSRTSPPRLPLPWRLSVASGNFGRCRWSWRTGTASQPWGNLPPRLLTN